MANDNSFTAFLGDAEHVFELKGKHVATLEKECGTGIGTIFKRLTEGRFHHADIRTVIRLALIGGGTMTPQEVSDFCATWVIDRPIIESYPIALTILERLWFGAPVEQAINEEISKGADHAA